MATEQAIADAIKARRQEFLAQQQTLSVKNVRRIIEQDLGLAKKSLDQQKDLVVKLIDKIILDTAEGTVDQSTEQLKSSEQLKVTASKRIAEGKQQSESSKKRPNERSVQHDSMEDEAPVKKKSSKAAKAEAQPAKKRRTASDAEDVAPKKGKGKQTAAAAFPGGSKYGPKVQKLQRICRGAGIAIPPAMYKKNPDPDSLEEALAELLNKYGLSAKSDERAISRVRAKLELQRDMEGIDMSNIINDADRGGRGGRPRRAAAPVSYRQMLQQDAENEGNQDEEEREDGDESGSDEGSESGDSDDEGSNEKRRKPAGVVKKQKKKRRVEDSDDVDVGDDDADVGSQSSGSASEESDSEQQGSDSEDKLEAGTTQPQKKTTTVSSIKAANRTVMQGSNDGLQNTGDLAGKDSGEDDQIVNGEKSKTARPKGKLKKKAAVIDSSDDEDVREEQEEEELQQQLNEESDGEEESDFEAVEDDQ